MSGKRARLAAALAVVGVISAAVWFSLQNRKENSDRLEHKNIEAATAAGAAAVAAVDTRSAELDTGDKFAQPAVDRVLIQEDPPKDYLPPGYQSWDDFRIKRQKFIERRVEMQKRLPINEDGSRVWLGELIYGDRALDEYILVHRQAVAMKAIPSVPKFRLMDGRVVNIEPSSGLNDISAKGIKKFAKIFGWLDEEASVIRVRYIDIAGTIYMPKNGQYVVN